VIRSWKDGSQACTASLNGTYSDIIFRVQRIDATNLLTAEVWKSADGSGYVAANCTLSNPNAGGVPTDGGNSFSVGTTLANIAYIREYSTTVAPGTPPSNNFDGDILDYEFEGNGNDSSGHAQNLTMSGTTYGATPIYAPAPLFGVYGQPRSFEAGRGSLQLNSSSFTSTDLATLSNFWTQISGPAIGNFSSRTSSNPTFSAPVAGTYRLQLTVTDSTGSSGVTAVDFGAVAADAGHQVINYILDSTTTSKMDVVLGPLTRWGTSPWPWYDLTEMASADSLGPYQLTGPPTPTSVSGTFALAGSSGNATVVGTGTTFTSMGWTPGITTFVIGLPGASTPDGLPGALVARLGSITDDTHVSLDGNMAPVPVPMAGVTLSTVPSGSYDYWGLSAQPFSSWNFYDCVLGHYREWRRSGLEIYHQYATALADWWYHYGLNHGYRIPFPKSAGLDGLILRAIDGKPAYWDGILYFLRYPIGWTYQFTQGPVAPGSTIEPRESGYALRAAALVARLHPSSTVRTEFCGYVANAVVNVWPNVQDDLGNFEEDVYAGNQSYPYKAYNGHFGSSPWRATLALLGLQAAYEALADTSGCNNPTAAATALTTITKFTVFVHDYGTGSSRGQLYSVGYETLGQEPLAGAGGNAATPNTTGTLSITNGSNIVTGTGTNFMTVFWGVTGATGATQATRFGNPVTRPTKYIGIPGNCLKVFEVASVQSNTQITLTTNVNCPTQTNITHGVPAYNWVATWEADNDCSPALSAYCEGGPTGSRDLTHDIHAAYMWLYKRTSNITYRNWAEDSLGADYGGPDTGPGPYSPSDVWTSPLSDGGHGNFWDALPTCGTAPCSAAGGGPTINFGKSFGMSAGAGNAPNAIALYMGTPEAATTRTVTIPFRIASVPGSAKAQVTITKPDGSSTVTQCATTPCTVTVEQRQKDHLYQLDYLSSGGAVLAPGSPLRLVVP
jgi:hypothetical protein